MTNKEAIEIIKHNCYIFNPLNFDRTTLVNTALDRAIEALEKAGDNEVKQRRKSNMQSL